MKKKIENFRETFVKAKEPESSYSNLKEIHHDAPDKTVKLLIVSDPSF